ncbi:uroporphyrinogen decarboxylase [Luteococcus sp. H154]|uniref:uroporphyrinogen decarboxylase n=1 Tax=unclassified Luteococcus TaxID=2639923 RepID=UPI00313D6758
MTDLSTPTLVAAARRQQGTQLPVWFMRQAGRSLPEYRELRVGTRMLDACSDPGMIHEITLQPVRRHQVDAAIFFSDIVLPLKAIGVDLDIVAGTGPVIAQPVRTRRDLDQLVPLEAGHVGFVTEAIGSIVQELGATPLIGFAGAPFTLASYLVEGGPSKDHALTKSMMAGDPELWDELCRRLAQISGTFLQVQIDAGAQAVQLFDSWAGALAERDYRERVLPHSRAVLGGLTGDVPTIHFGVGTAELLGAMGEVGSDVVGVDWRTPLDVATTRIGPDKAVQGNLDPALLLAPWEVLAERVREVIRAGAKAPGHIVNLGHGVPPTTDPTVLTRIVELVHTEGPALRAEAGC